MTHPRERQLPWMFTWKMCNFTASSERLCQFNFGPTVNKVNGSSPSAALLASPRSAASSCSSSHRAPPALRKEHCSASTPGRPAGFLCFRAGGHWGILRIFLVVLCCKRAVVLFPPFGKEGGWKTFVVMLGRFKEGLLANVQRWRRMAFLSFLNIKEGREKSRIFFPGPGVVLQCNSIWCHRGRSLRCVPSTGAASVQGLVAESS